jgi:hypothetical protein
METMKKAWKDASSTPEGRTSSEPEHSMDDAFVFDGTNVEPCFVKSCSTSGDVDDRPTEAGAYVLYDLVVPTAPAPDSSAVATLMDFDF